MAALGNTRFGDPNNGHGTCPTVPTKGSPTTYIDGLMQIRTTDSYFSHSCPTTHGTAASMGSPTSFVDSLSVFRRFDPLTCGDFSAKGSITSVTG